MQHAADASGRERASQVAEGSGQQYCDDDEDVSHLLGGGANRRMGTTQTLI